MSDAELALDPNLTFEQWCEAGHDICRDHHNRQWRAGDWAAFGEKKYGRLKEFADANKHVISYQTLKNWARVSRGVKPYLRGYGLEYSFYKEVATDKLNEREKKKWLEMASQEGLTVGQFRTQIRQSMGDKSALVSEGPSLEMGTKYYGDLAHWLKNRPQGFWTVRTSAIWKERIRELSELIPS